MKLDFRKNLQGILKGHGYNLLGEKLVYKIEVRKFSDGCYIYKYQFRNKHFFMEDNYFIPCGRNPETLKERTLKALEDVKKKIKFSSWSL